MTRVLFLSQYQSPTGGGSGGGSSGSGSGAIITPPFITGTDMNHTVTLWSSWKSGLGYRHRHHDGGPGHGPDRLS